MFEGDYLRIEENQEVKTLPLLTFLDLEIKDGYARGNNKGLKCFDKSYFETFVVAFFLFSMLEVAPLESTSQHCFRLWFCLGSIISKTQNYDNIITNIKLQQRKGHN